MTTGVTREVCQTLTLILSRLDDLDRTILGTLPPGSTKGPTPITTNKNGDAGT
jgi:hypothetical protein